MSANLSPQTGPLIWVKPEIDSALERAAGALEQFFSSPASQEELKAAQAGLREAHGALSMIGMEGLARFAEEIAGVLSALESRGAVPSQALLDLLKRSLSTVAQYLGDIAAGEADQPMSLLPVMRELARAQGHSEVDGKELFFPDLSLLPPPHSAAIPVAPQALPSLIKLQRSRYQRGLLNWLKEIDDGLETMRDALQEIDRSQPQAQRAFSWVATGLLEALLHSGLPASDPLKKLCGRIDRQLGAYASGEWQQPEAVIREMLYALAKCEPVTPLIANIKSLYRLDRHTAPSSIAGLIELDLDRIEPLLADARDTLAAAKDDWTGFSAGNREKLAGFREKVGKFHALAGDLGNQPLADLAELIKRVSTVLRAQGGERQNVITMEMATALLAAEQALSRFTSLTPRIEAHVEAIAARLLNALSGKTTDTGGAVAPMMDETGRKSEEKNLISQVAREMHTNLQHVEQVLDGYFRGTASRDQLVALEPFTRHVVGALRMLGLEPAAELLQHCSAIIAMLGDRKHAPSQYETNLLADGLSSLAFYVQALEHGAAQEQHMVKTVLERFRSGEDKPPGPITNVKELRHQAADAGIDLAPEQEPEPEVPSSAAELAAEGSGIATGGDPGLMALTRKSAGRAAAQAASEPTATPSPARAAAPACQVDPEIVQIYLEEAREILTSMADLLTRCQAEPGNRNTLIDMRRGFHTLKGSGRMAGLTDLGEGAWTVERLMNQWLELEHDATPSLLEFLRSAHATFDDWIGVLEAGGQPVIDGSSLAEMAGALRAYLESGVSGVPAPTPAPAAAAQETPEPVQEDFVTVGAVTLPHSLYPIYLSEARQCVDTLQREMAAWEAHPSRAPSEEFMRAAHTLAGSSRTAGFAPMNELASVLERLANESRAHAAGMNPGQLEIVSRAVSGLTRRVADIETRQALQPCRDEVEALQRLSQELAREWSQAHVAALEAPAPEVVAPPVPDVPVEAKPAGERRVVKDDIDRQLLPIFLEESHDLVPLIGQDLRHLRAEPNDQRASQSLRRVLHTIKGSGRMVGAMRLAELVHAMETQVEEAIERSAFSPELFDNLEAQLDRLVTALEALQRRTEPEEATPGSAAASAPSAADEALEQAELSEEQAAPSFTAQIRVAAETVDRLVNQAGEISIARARIDVESQGFKRTLLELTDSVSRLRNQLREIEIHAESRLQARLSRVQEHDQVFDPLEFDRYTRFQELTRLMAESLHDVTTVQQNLLIGLDEVNAALSSQGRLNRQLQDNLMQLRTVPFRNVSERIYRIVRQAAGELNKKAHFEITGGQVEVDRGVLERLIAPLEHLIRNAVVHGIEVPEQRLRSGKPESGRVHLVLRQETNDLVISLSDDGGGLNHDAIRAKGIATGLIAQDQETTPQQLAQLIFTPGFSTASELTELSGRGIGMDVVASELQAMGGRIEVNSDPGKGTTFTLRVPLTLAVTKALLVGAGTRTWAVLSGMVEQVQELGACALEGLFAQGELDWMGNRYPLFYLPQLLGEAGAKPELRERNYVLLLRAGESRVAVKVDSISTNLDVVLKKLGPQLSRVPGIAGATVLPNGRVVLLINPVLLVDRALARSELPAQTVAEKVVEAPLVMVVDDSLTVRNVTGRFLTRRGFRVVTAKDGLDALQQLQERVPDVMLVDIEMPRMDGFDLTKNVRADTRTAGIPIIMITSRLAQKHRDYATRLGVNVYLGKPYQEDELLEHIGHLTQALR